MGYHTDFFGTFKLNKPLAENHKAYLQQFANMRHMRRDPKIAASISDPIRLAVDLPIGNECEFFVAGAGYAGQEKDPSIIDYNTQASTQPGLWCKWEPNEDGTEIRWNGAEKFYDYVEWLQYLVTNFLTPWGYSITEESRVKYKGEDENDVGAIFVADNVVKRTSYSVLR